jgi:hypothetical protein
MISYYFFKSLKKRFLFLFFLIKKMEIKKYILNLIGYDDKFSIFILKLIFLYPILKLFIDFIYIFFLLLIEIYLSFIDSIFDFFFDGLYFFGTLNTINNNRFLLFLNRKIFNLLKKLHILFSLKFLKIDFKNFYLDMFFFSIMDSFFLFLAGIIDFLLSVGFAVAVGRFFLIFRQIFVLILKFLKIIVFLFFSIILICVNFLFSKLYLRSNYRFKKRLIKVYKRFLKIPNIILTDFEKNYILKNLGKKNQLKYFKNTKYDFLQPLSESRHFKKKIV